MQAQQTPARCNTPEQQRAYKGTSAQQATGSPLRITAASGGSRPSSSPSAFGHSVSRTTPREPAPRQSPTGRSSRHAPAAAATVAQISTQLPAPAAQGATRPAVAAPPKMKKGK
jgi:hypothetical protein